MEIKKRGSGNQRVARTQRRTNDSIKNPGRRHDRDAGIALQRYITPITALTGERYPDIRTRIGVPTVMNARNLPDMGRMNGNWRWRIDLWLSAGLKGRPTGQDSTMHVLTFFFANRQEDRAVLADAYLQSPLSWFASKP